MKIVTEELRTVVERQVEESDFSQLPYLQAVIKKESFVFILRFH